MAEPVLQPRLSRLPIVWAIGWVAALGLAFFSIPWPFVDVHNNLREATAWSWPQYLRYAFGGGLEYRPLLTIALKAAYEVVGLHLWLYQALVLLQFAVILALLVWLFRPVGARRGLAAAIALACVVGLHTSRILFLFVPLNAYSAALIATLLAIALALHPHTRAFDWLFFPLTFVALLVLESSLLIIPVVVTLWWMQAPGVNRRGVVCTLAAGVIYLVMRVGLGAPADLSSSYTGSGLGFSQLAPETLRDIFERAPWLFWLYNLAASFLTVVASEPRAGVYRFVASLLSGETPFWHWLQVGSSIVTTIVVAAGLLRHRPASSRDRQLVACGVVLIVAGSGLGFLYTRDRIALSAGIGYGLLLYVALAMWLEHLPAAAWKRALVVIGMSILALAWSVRDGETYAQLRDTAWEFHLEWTDRYPDLGGALPQTELLTRLRSAVLRTNPADPRLDPPWTYVLFERRFSRDGVAATSSVDGEADAAVLPESMPFNIRWAPDVDETARLRLEAELGLAAAQPVDRDPSGRTWEYRLRMPTRERVRAIVQNAAVEDTAKIETRRFEILH